MAGNQYEEDWTIDKATELFDDAIELSKSKNIDFIGEVARDLGTYRDVFTYLVKKFPELKHSHNILISNVEANCFSHGKKGDINTAMAIVNLKSNHGWTDRVDATTNGNDINIAPIEWVD